MGFFRRATVTDPETQIQRLEMKVNALIAICAVQVLMVAFLLVTQFAELLLPSGFTLLVIVVLLGVAAYVFRNRLPAIFGAVFGTVFRLIAAKKEDAPDSSDHKFQ